MPLQWLSALKILSFPHKDGSSERSALLFGWLFFLFFCYCPCRRWPFLKNALNWGTAYWFIFKYCKRPFLSLECISWWQFDILNFYSKILLLSSTCVVKMLPSEPDNALNLGIQDLCKLSKFTLKSLINNYYFAPFSYSQIDPMYKSIKKEYFRICDKVNAIWIWHII